MPHRECQVILGNQKKTPSKLNCLWSLSSVWQGRHSGLERVLQWFEYWTSSLSDFSCSQHGGRSHGLSWWTHLGNRKMILVIISSSSYEAQRQKPHFWLFSGYKWKGILGIHRQFGITLERDHFQIWKHYSHLLSMGWDSVYRRTE